MEILIKGLPSGYEIEHLARIFYPGIPLRKTAASRGALVYARAGKTRMAVGLRAGKACHVCTASPQAGVPAKQQLSGMLYTLLQAQTGQKPPWGMLTGVRPVNFLRHALQHGNAAAQTELLETYHVSQEKYNLAHEIVCRQQPFLQASAPRSYSLYVSIPFCPSRCSYCSFVSRTLQRDTAIVQPYLEALEREMAQTAQVAKTCGLTLETIYIGGGTPTALTPPQLRFLLQSVQKHFNTTIIKEYTVEAGRPDCTDYEKLALLKQFGVSRISINPQSMHNEVLAAIGRGHTAADIVRCFEDARRAGHQNINMDLIAGLPKDTEQRFAKTLQTLLALAPENITIHTLTLKRASNMVIEQSASGSSPANMIAAAYPQLYQHGYVPYYLYRQKNTVENFENTGWAKPGTEGLYNIFIMEEAQTILALGAGASTKLVAPGGRIQRVYNYKYPAEYLEGFNEILARKKGVEAFYAGNLDTQTPGGHWAD
ncbi:coproporphyrinogen dehydrogenase HemZ [Ruminococcaceae bacterium OttesenSCG-928-A16]|nr:coproporphyrinogen dehydrogenase HemZ [Ruminococcaceae bacterium OttesenSCG-928-A16]